MGRTFLSVVLSSFVSGRYDATIIMGDSGQIQLDGDTIRYRSAVFGDWDLPVADVRIVGESTNDRGPTLDDYFFCFATGPDMWWEASFYAEGRDEFLRALREKLGCSQELGLLGSTDFASRVLWPPSLAGEPMFQYTDEHPTTFVGKLGKLLLGLERNRQTYTDRVAAMLAGDG